jgi:hypothetical protein
MAYGIAATDLQDLAMASARAVHLAVAKILPAERVAARLSQRPSRCATMTSLRRDESGGSCASPPEGAFVHTKDRT